MSNTIATIRKHIDRFIFEAEECEKAEKSKERFGFAAMSTIFSVILSISEAVGTQDGIFKDNDDKNLLRYFVSRMTDKTWLVSRGPKSTLSDDDIATELYHVRNGLAHQLSLPDYICLANNKSEVKELMKECPTVKRAICVVEFLEAVKTTVGDLAQDYPDAILDPNPQGVSRTIAVRVVLPSGTSASPAGPAS